MSWSNEQGGQSNHEARVHSGIGVFLEQASSSTDVPQSSRANTVLSTKDYSNPNYCKICHVSCNNVVVYEDHIKGKNHLKKLKALGIENPKKLKALGIENPELAVGNSVHIPKVEKFVTLAQKLAANPHEPIVGLSYIEEFWTATDPDHNPPRYSCTLCSVTAEVEPIFMHITGSKHRVKYMEMVLGMEVTNKSSQAVMDQAFAIEGMEGRDVSVIVKTISDEKYPMPIGQKAKKAKLSISSPESPVQHLLSALVEGAIKNESDAQLAYKVADALIGKLSEHRVSMSHPVSRPEAKKSWDNLLETLKRLNQSNASPSNIQNSDEEHAKQNPRKRLPYQNYQNQQGIQPKRRNVVEDTYHANFNYCPPNETEMLPGMRQHPPPPCISQSYHDPNSRQYHLQNDTMVESPDFYYSAPPPNFHNNAPRYPR